MHFFNIKSDLEENNFLHKMEQVSSFTTRISVRLHGAAGGTFKEELQLEEAARYVSLWLPRIKLFTKDTQGETLWNAMLEVKPRLLALFNQQQS